MNTLLRRCLPLFLAPLAFGQGSQLPKYTVATLPSATSNPTMTVQIIDALTTGQCTTGGGSFNVICTPHAGVWTAVGPGTGQVYPGAGVANSTGSAWGTSYAVGTSANDLVQLNGSSQLPAVSGALLTNLPFMSLTTTGTSGAATLSGGVLNIPQYAGGGGSGVQYNPTTTAYIFGTYSGVYDDSDANSRSLGVPTSVSCTGTNPTTCAVNFGSAHGVGVAGAVDMSNLASWPVSPSGGVQQAAQYGSFQVTTVPNSTSLTFTTPTPLTYACSPCTGNVYDASFWAIWDFAREPFIYGHGTVYGVENTSANIASGFATYTAGITGSPIYYIDQSGQNNFATGASVATVEGYHQTIWAAAHAAGMIVIQTTMVPSGYGLTPVDTKPAQINNWYWQQTQTPSNTASGQYIDRYVDTATATLTAPGAQTMPNPEPNVYFADAINHAFSAQKSTEAFPPTNITVSTSSGNLPGEYSGDRKFFYTNSWLWWMDWNPLVDGITLYSRSGGSVLSMKNPSLGVGFTWCSNYTLVNDYGTNNGFGQCFTNAGSGSTANYVSWKPIGGNDVIRLFTSGVVQIPGLATGSAYALGVDTLGNLQAAAGSLTNPMTTLGDALYGGVAGAPTRLAGPTTASHLFLLGWTPSGTAIAPTAYDFGANAATWIKATSPLVATQNANDVTLSCPSCGTSTGGTNVSQNSGAAETNLPITGFMPQACSDTSGSGTAQACTVANTFVPQANNCVVYTTTTTNSGTGLTVNVNSLGAKSVAIPGASGWTTTLTASIIPANKPLNMCYDGTNWNVQQTGTASTGSTGAVTNITGAVTITGCTVTSGNCVVTGSPSSAIAISAIPGTYIDLEISFFGTNSTAANVNLNTIFNSDTGANYDYTLIFANAGSSTVTGSSGTAANFGILGGLGQTGSFSGGGKILIPQYASTTLQKTGTAIFGLTTSGQHQATLSSSVTWHSTAAITAITLTPASGNWSVGDAIVIRGLN